MRWQDIFRTVPAEPRPLTLPELRRLSQIAPALAAAHAAGTCPDCGLNRTGSTHQRVCTPAERRENPLTPRAQAAQPWEPRPSRYAASHQAA